jgi:hypothetical protein
MKKKFGWLLILCGLFVFLTEYSAARGQPSTELDPKYDRFTYRLESDKVLVGVTTFVARYREKDKYLPLEIGVANKKLNKLTLTRDSFTLIDELGNEYPLTSPEELLDNYRKQSVDLRIAHITHIFRSFFGGLSSVDSNFQPERPGHSLVWDRVELPRTYFMIDMLYFQHPATGIRGKKFELRVSTPELEEPLQVRFMVE